MTHPAEPKDLVGRARWWAEYVVPDLPGIVDVLTELAAALAAVKPDWAYTPEGHDSCFEYVSNYDCDGALIAHFRRLPKRVQPVGDWNRIESLPEAATRLLVGPMPGEEVRS